MAVEWPVPFGLVMIETMVCGLIAFRSGSVPEVVDEGIGLQVFSCVKTQLGEKYKVTQPAA